MRDVEKPNPAFGSVQASPTHALRTKMLEGERPHKRVQNRARVTMRQADRCLALSTHELRNRRIRLLDVAHTRELSQLRRIDLNYKVVGRYPILLGAWG